MKRTKKKIREYMEKWTEPLGLLWWKISVHFVTEPPDVVAHFRDDESGVAVAKTYSSWEYLEADIYFNVAALSKHDDGDIEKAVLHELCHILVCETRENEIHHEERVVSSLQRAFIWTRLAGELSAKGEK